jgi:hypothetical protein
MLTTVSSLVDSACSQLGDILVILLCYLRVLAQRWLNWVPVEEEVKQEKR